MFLTELAHFDNEGWCILAKENFMEEEGLDNYEWITLSEPARVFTTSKKFTSRHEKQMCRVRYQEIEEENKLELGDKIYYLLPRSSQVRYGEITYINHETLDLVINNIIKTKILSAMKFEHNFEKIKDTKAEICKACKAIHTPMK